MSRVLIVILTLSFLQILPLVDSASAAASPEPVLYLRCYAQLTGLRASTVDPLYLQSQIGSTQSLCGMLATGKTRSVECKR